MAAEPVLIVHIADHLQVGGCCRVMESFCRARAHPAVRHVMAGGRPDQVFLDQLRRDGVAAYALDADGGIPREALAGHAALAVMAHRSGEETEWWNHTLAQAAALRPLALLERKIFGYPDRSDAGRRFDVVFCNSISTLHRHWRESGRPDLTRYLARHRVLYNATLFERPPATLAESRARARAQWGAPEGAFVIGDLTRPDLKKHGAMLDVLAPALAKRLPEVFVVTRSYPESLAASVGARMGGRYRNLPPSARLDEVAATYAGLDALAHFSALGESYGMAIAEAMRCGLPCVVNSTPGWKHDNAQVELVRDGENGFVANEPGAMLEAIETLARDPDLRRRFGDAGRARFDSGPMSLPAVVTTVEREALLRAASAGIVSAERVPPPPPAVGSAEIARWLAAREAGERFDRPARDPGPLLWRASVAARAFSWRVRALLA
ncbi:MAG: glycosyltransferase [Planctomycetes bacterium]|nr:glycosyltransferase [Planctomycetota bacterium]